MCAHEKGSDPQPPSGIPEWGLQQQCCSPTTGEGGVAFSDSNSMQMSGKHALYLCFSPGSSTSGFPHSLALVAAVHSNGS